MSVHYSHQVSHKFIILNRSRLEDIIFIPTPASPPSSFSLLGAITWTLLFTLISLPPPFSVFLVMVHGHSYFASIVQVVLPNGCAGPYLSNQQDISPYPAHTEWNSVFEIFANGYKIIALCYVSLLSYSWWVSFLNVLFWICCLLINFAHFSIEVTVFFFADWFNLISYLSYFIF